jgi:hypothetical protein
LSEDDYVAEKSEIEHERNILVPPDGTARTRPLADYAAAVETFKSFSDVYEGADMAQRKELFHLIVEKLLVFNSKIAAIQPRLAFYPIFYISCGPDEYGAHVA